VIWRGWVGVFFDFGFWMGVWLMGCGLRGFGGGFDRREGWRLCGVRVFVFLRGGF
jgi:hypothetical protein